MDLVDDKIIYGILATYGTFIIIIIVAIIAAHWKLFKKAGVAGWWSIIPFANIWQTIKIANGKGSLGMFLLLLVPIVNVVVGIIISYRFARTYVKSSTLAVLYVFFPFVVGLVLAFNKEFVYQNPLTGGDSVHEPLYQS